MKFVIEQIAVENSDYNFHVRITKHTDTGEISDVWQQHRGEGNFQEAAAGAFAYVTGFEITEMNFDDDECDCPVCMPDQEPDLDFSK